jgi:hypothetical protein
MFYKNVSIEGQIGEQFTFQVGSHPKHEIEDYKVWNKDVAVAIFSSGRISYGVGFNIASPTFAKEGSGGYLKSLYIRPHKENLQ